MKILPSSIVIACAAVVLCMNGAQAMTVDAVPNPQTERASFVQDSGGVLGPEYCTMIDGISRQLNAATGAELAIVTVDDLGGTTVEDFAERLFQRFGIGERGKDNGLLILFSRDDRKVRIEVGYGLEDALNDARAGRLLDEYAIPRFKSGEYGRGLYDTAMAVAELVAVRQGAALDIDGPERWPDQVTPPAIPDSAATPAAALNLYEAVAAYMAFFAAITAGGLFLLAVRIRLTKAKAAKIKAMGRGIVFPVILWFGGGIAMIAIGSMSNTVLLPLVSFAAAGSLATFVHVRTRRRLKAYIADYHIPCPSCGRPMNIIDEALDDALLSVEEIAEEKAQGMDYEFWRCEPCDRLERLEVKIGKASKCPRCSHLTLTKTVAVLQAATTSSKGRERIQEVCANPKCDYRHEFERTTPRLSSSSGSSSWGGSSGISFGGGSSGGGGASRGW